MDRAGLLGLVGERAARHGDIRRIGVAVEAPDHRSLGWIRVNELRVKNRLHTGRTPSMPDTGMPSPAAGSACVEAALLGYQQY